MIRPIHTCFHPKLPAYGLIEILIALIVVGFLLRSSVGQLFGGVNDARIRTAISQYKNLRSAVSQFYETYDALPGDFDEAIDVFGADSVNGDGNGRVSGKGLNTPNTSEAAAFWLHLHQAKLIVLPDEISKAQLLRINRQTLDSGFAKAGFSVHHGPNGWEGLWLVLGAANGTATSASAFTPQQAQKFLKTTGLKAPQVGNIRVGNGTDSSKCLRGRRLNLSHKERACVIYFKLWDE